MKAHWMQFKNVSLSAKQITLVAPLTIHINTLPPANAHQTYLTCRYDRFCL